MRLGNNQFWAIRDTATALLTDPSWPELKRNDPAYDPNFVERANNHLNTVQTKYNIMSDVQIVRHAEQLVTMFTGVGYEVEIDANLTRLNELVAPLAEQLDLARQHELEAKRQGFKQLKMRLR